MDERALHNEMRLLAIEHVLTVLVATQLTEAGDAIANVERFRNIALEAARTHVFDVFRDPAISDAASAEFEQALDRLAMMTRAKIEEHYGRG
jgi:hypothetical protein